MEENLKLKGKIHYELRDEFGNLKEEKDIDNTITNLFKQHVAFQVGTPTAGSEIGFMALGSGTGQTAASTDLAKYVNIIALSGAGGLVTGSNTVYSAYWAAGVATNPAISEAGIFQLSGTSRNTLYTYNDTLSINKGASDTLKIDWTITFG